jgi:GLPGLI family protein
MKGYIMKKIFILLILIVLSVNFIIAQNTSGKISYTVKHDWIKKISAVDYMDKSQRERYEYVWGNRSAYETKGVLFYNSNSYRYEDLNEDNNFHGHSQRSDEYFIFRNLEDNTTYDVMRTLDKLYLIEDSIQYPNWKVLNDLKEVAGHICMNASYYDELKENNVVAWFALDWPGNFGPERFGGLPGVILEIDINKGAQVITATDVVEYEQDTLIEKPTHKKRIKILSESDYNKLITKRMEESKKQGRPYFWGMRY